MTHHARITVLLVVLASAVTLAAPAQSPTPAASPADDFTLAMPPTTLPEPIPAALASITGEALGAHVRFFASPTLEGRGLGSPGLDAAAEYVAATLARAGIHPLPRPESTPQPESASGSSAVPTWYQPVPLRLVSPASGRVIVERRDRDTAWRRPFTAGVDCMIPAQLPRSVQAPVVFAGYGIREPSAVRDDYRGLDARGRIVLILGGVPDGTVWQSAELQSRFNAAQVRQRWAAKLATAKEAGAVAVLAVEGDDWAGKVIGESDEDDSRFFPFDRTGDDTEPIVVRVSPVLADSLLATAGLSCATARAGASRLLPGATATVQVEGSETLMTSRNVVGFIPGADPKLEAIVIGAHIDHLGIVDGVIHPGADDNASGAAALIEIASAFAHAQRAPRRTVVFAFWTGEEEGKLGSGHWVRHPLWPLERTAAYLNLDMIGHPWLVEEIRDLVAGAKLPDAEAYLARVTAADFAEPGVAEWAPELVMALRQAGPAVGLALHFDRSTGTGGGSDYRDFARAHVPWIRFFGNFFPGYHEPGDTADRLDTGQAAKLARLCFATAWLLADR